MKYTYHPDSDCERIAPSLPNHYRNTPLYKKTQNTKEPHFMPKNRTLYGRGYANFISQPARPFSARFPPASIVWPTKK